MTFEKALQLSMDHGFTTYGHEVTALVVSTFKYQILLDPIFWMSLYEARKWEGGWLNKMRGMIDFISDGSTVDEYIEKL